MFPPRILLFFGHFGEFVLVQGTFGLHFADFVGMDRMREPDLLRFDPIRGGVQREEAAVDFHLVFFAQYHVGGRLLWNVLLKTRLIRNKLI